MSVARQLIGSDRCFLEAPAGYGKTYTIAEAVSELDGVQLVLTHTHAGVHSLRHKLNQFSVPTSKYCLDTIAGWCLRIANYYPATTRFKNKIPVANSDYQQIYKGLANLLELHVMQKVMTSSYDGVIVDEYQDCTRLQHAVVLSLANILPCRILGDPLQGIFDFNDNDPLVSWHTDIEPNFEKIPPLDVPYRWKDRNEPLAKWLRTIRAGLQNGQNVDLRTGNSASVYWIRKSESSNRDACWNKVNIPGNVVAIHSFSKNPSPCHKLASQLGGRYQSLETSDAPDLHHWARKLDDAKGNERSVWLIDFVTKCCTKVSSDLRTIRTKFETSSRPDFSRIRKHRDIADQLMQIAETNDFSLFPETMERVRSSVCGLITYRSDLWYSMLAAIKENDTSSDEELSETTWRVRQRQKRIGRTQYQRIVSRTLLVKGLEYDHSILLDADHFDKKNLYVALTRASQSVTVISKNPILCPQ